MNEGFGVKVVLLFSYLLTFFLILFFSPSQVLFFPSRFPLVHSLTVSRCLLLSCQHMLWHYHYTILTYSLQSAVSHLGQYIQNGTQIHHFCSMVLNSFNALLFLTIDKLEFFYRSSHFLSINHFSLLATVRLLFTPSCSFVFRHIALYSQLYLTQIANHTVHITGSRSRDYRACASFSPSRTEGSELFYFLFFFFFLNGGHGVPHACTFQ